MDDGVVRRGERGVMLSRARASVYSLLAPSALSRWLTLSLTTRSFTHSLTHPHSLTHLTHSLPHSPTPTPTPTPTRTLGPMRVGQASLSKMSLIGMLIT